MNYSNYTILVAEDDDGNFQLLEYYLSEFNCKVIRAINGNEAIEIYKKNKNIDLIFMDVRMPLIDGIEASQKIRLINNNAKIIFVTAFAYDNEEILKFLKNCNKVLSKPITTEIIKEIFLQYFQPY